MKLHIGVDVLGLPHAIWYTTADVDDRAGAVEMVEFYTYNTDHLDSVQKILADGGYTGEKFSDEIAEVCGAEVEVVKRSEPHTFTVLPKRWIVERTLSWLDNCRRIWKNCERFLHTSRQIITLAFIRLLLNRL